MFLSVIKLAWFVNVNPIILLAYKRSIKVILDLNGVIVTNKTICKLFDF